MNLKVFIFPILVVIVLLSIFAYAIDQRDKYITTKSSLESAVAINKSLSNQLEQTMNQIKILDNSLSSWINKKNKEHESLQSDTKKADKLLEVRNGKNYNDYTFDDDLVSLLNQTCNRAKGSICETP